MKIKSIKKLNKKNDRYDLTVNTTSNFFANKILIHNSSGRVTHGKTIRLKEKKEERNIFVRSSNRLVKSVSYCKTEEESYEFITGSRRVVLFEDNSAKVGFHGSEQYRFDILNSFKPYLTKGLSIYFEIVGFVNGAPIMGSHDIGKLKDEVFVQKYGKTITYKYGCLPDQYKVLVYRISLTSEDGNTVDFTSQQVINWCEKRGFIASKPIIPPFIYDGNKKKLSETVLELADRPDKLCEDYVDPSHVNEGVVIRCDYGEQSPLLLKYKSFCFRTLEGIYKESGNLDVEDAS
jgi:ribosomal protein S10